VYLCLVFNLNSLEMNHIEIMEQLVVLSID
jgi:hypothetical protein